MGTATILPTPPVSLIEGAALFLDFDGTLVELAEAPDAIFVPGGLPKLLGSLAARLSGRLAIVSGRSISDLDRHMKLAGLAVSGSHGLELRLPNGTMHAPPPSPLMASAYEQIARFADGADGLLIEEKPASIALHYRQAPERAESVERFMADLARSAGLSLQHGKMVAELRPSGADKGDALRALMAEPEFAGARPLFVGDDLTDEHAFEAAAGMGGAGILVGAPRPSAARYRLPDVPAVAAWLEAGAAA